MPHASCFPCCNRRGSIRECTYTLVLFISRIVERVQSLGIVSVGLQHVSQCTSDARACPYQLPSHSHQARCQRQDTRHNSPIAESAKLESHPTARLEQPLDPLHHPRRIALAPVQRGGRKDCIKRAAEGRVEQDGQVLNVGLLQRDLGRVCRRGIRAGLGELHVRISLMLSLLWSADRCNGQEEG